MTKTHYRTCNLCEAMCGLEIKYEGENVISIKGDEEDPFSKGYICPKAVALQDIYADPDRLRRPVKKTHSGWQEISWKEAFDEITARLKSIQVKYGPDSVGIYQGNPSVHNLGTMLFGPNFTRSLGTKNKFSATSADQLPHHFVSQLMLGHLLLIPVPDIDRTDYFLVFGANPMASNGSMMSAGGMPNRLKSLKKRGGKMVIVDPRRTETAKIADRHLSIIPGTDAFLLAGMIHLIFREGLIPELPGYFKNLDEIEPLFEYFNPELVAAQTGISQEELAALVDDFIKADRAVCYGRMGVSTQEHGALCQYLIYLVNMLSGNFDAPGGFMFANPAVDVVKAFGARGTSKRFDRWKSQVRQLPEFGGELPVATMAEEILNEGAQKIRAMITSAGNPVLSTPNGTRLDAALDSLDFMVSIDIYINETTRHADIILPPATGLETQHYDLVFNNLAVRNFAKFSDQLFKPSKGALEDWQIFKELTRRFKKQSIKEKLIHYFLTPSRALNFGLKRGPYPGMSLSRLKKFPHGIDLGELKPCMPARLFTEDKMIDLAPKILTDALQKLRSHKSNGSALKLIGRRYLRSNNSWMHNAERLVKGVNKCTLLIHPEDASEMAISDGQLVKVSSRAGAIKIPAEISDEIRKGVVSIPHGWGHDRSGTRWRTAESHAGVSINDITDELAVDHVSGNAAFNGVLVEIEAMN